MLVMEWDIQAEMCTSNWVKLLRGFDEAQACSGPVGYGAGGEAMLVDGVVVVQLVDEMERKEIDRTLSSQLVFSDPGAFLAIEEYATLVTESLERLSLTHQSPYTVTISASQTSILHPTGYKLSGDLTVLPLLYNISTRHNPPYLDTPASDTRTCRSPAGEAEQQRRTTKRCTTTSLGTPPLHNIDMHLTGLANSSTRDLQPHCPQHADGAKDSWGTTSDTSRLVVRVIDVQLLGWASGFRGETRITGYAYRGPLSAGQLRFKIKFMGTWSARLALAASSGVSETPDSFTARDRLGWHRPWPRDVAHRSGSLRIRPQGALHFATQLQLTSVACLDLGTYADGHACATRRSVVAHARLVLFWAKDVSALHLVALARCDPTLASPCLVRNTGRRPANPPSNLACTPTLSCDSGDAAAATMNPDWKPTLHKR
ncbi:hypothetical protein SVAN01_09746 [Stagonosporopsis vannaccii]|nr:hypothetical protein SVAN01_09746 [Stagonosporopsis vannaccii]